MRDALAGPKYRTTTSLSALNLLGDIRTRDALSATSSMITETSMDDLMTTYLQFKGATDQQVQSLHDSFDHTIREQEEHFHESFMIHNNNEEESKQTEEHETDEKTKNKHADFFVPVATPTASDDDEEASPPPSPHRVTASLRLLIQEKRITQLQQEQSRVFDEVIQKVATQHLQEQLGGTSNGNLAKACRRSHLLSSSSPNLQWHPDPHTMTAPSIDTTSSADGSDHSENSTEKNLDGTSTTLPQAPNPATQTTQVGNQSLELSAGNSSTRSDETQQFQEEQKEQPQGQVTNSMDDSVTLTDLLQATNTPANTAKLHSAAKATLARRQHAAASSCSRPLLGGEAITGDDNVTTTNTDLMVDVMAALILAAPRHVAAQLVEQAHQIATMRRQEQDQQERRDTPPKPKQSDRKSRPHRLRSSSLTALATKPSRSSSSRSSSKSKPRSKSSGTTRDRMSASQPNSRARSHSKRHGRSDTKDKTDKKTKSGTKKKPSSSKRHPRLSSSMSQLDESLDESFRHGSSGSRRPKAQQESLRFLETFPEDKEPPTKTRRSRRSRSRDAQTIASKTRDVSHDSYTSLPVTPSKSKARRDSYQSLPILASPGKSSKMRDDSRDSHKSVPVPASTKEMPRDPSRDSWHSASTTPPRASSKDSRWKSPTSQRSRSKDLHSESATPRASSKDSRWKSPTSQRSRSKDSRLSASTTTTKSDKKSPTSRQSPGKDSSTRLLLALEEEKSKISHRGHSKDSRTPLPLDLSKKKDKSSRRVHSKDSRASLVSSDMADKKETSSRRGHSKDSRTSLSSKLKSKPKSTADQRSLSKDSRVSTTSDLASKKSSHRRGTSKDSRKSTPSKESPCTTITSKKNSSRSRSLSKGPPPSLSVEASAEATMQPRRALEHDLGKSLSAIGGAMKSKTKKSSSRHKQDAGGTPKRAKRRTLLSSAPELFSESMPVLQLDDSGDRSFAKTKKSVRSTKSNDAEAPTKTKTSVRSTKSDDPATIAVTSRKVRSTKLDGSSDDPSKLRASSLTSRRSRGARSSASKNSRVIADATDEVHVDRAGGKTTVSSKEDHITSLSSTRLGDFISQSTHQAPIADSLDPSTPTPTSLGTETTERVTNVTADAAGIDHTKVPAGMVSRLRNQLERASSTSVLMSQLTWDYKLSSSVKKQQPPKTAREETETAAKGDAAAKPKAARKRPQHKREDTDQSVSLHVAMDQLAASKHTTTKKSVLHMSLSHLVNDDSIEPATKSHLRERLRGVKTHM